MHKDLYQKAFCLFYPARSSRHPGNIFITSSLIIGGVPWAFPLKGDPIQSGGPVCSGSYNYMSDAVWEGL